MIAVALCILQLGNGDSFGDRDNLDLAYADLPESVIVIGGKVISDLFCQMTSTPLYLHLWLTSGIAVIGYFYYLL